jgi:uncharacterized membrane protein YoaT (DUF817 family)
MVGYRRTHDYPNGKPFPLILLEMAMAVLAISWVLFTPGHWPRAMAIVVAFLIVAFLGAKLDARYERRGQAVRIPRRRVISRFRDGLPVPMLAARLLFFLAAMMMIVFGLAPIADSIARIGIIACVFILIGVAILNLLLERHYVSTGVAKELDVF